MLTHLSPYLPLRTQGCGKQPTFGCFAAFKDEKPVGEFKTPPKSIAAFEVGFCSEDAAAALGMQPRAKLVRAIRSSINGCSSECRALPDEIVFATLAAAAIASCEDATIGAFDDFPYSFDDALTAVFECIKTGATYRGVAGHSGGCGAPIVHKSQKRIYNKTMKKWLALDSGALGAELRRVRAAEDATEAAAGGGAVSSSSSSSSAAASSASSSSGGKAKRHQSQGIRL